MNDHSYFLNHVIEREEGCTKAKYIRCDILEKSAEL